MRLRLPATVVALTVTCSLIQVASPISANHPNLRMDQGEIDTLVRAMLNAEDPSIRGSFSMNFQDDASFHEQSGFQWRPNRLFEITNTGFARSPTFLALNQLIYAYEPRVGRPDPNTDRMPLVRQFLNAVFASNTWQEFVNVLHAKQYPSPSATVEETKQKLRQIVGEAWFGLYSRTDYSNARPGSVRDTSAFEHVFAGEWSRDVDGGSRAIGLHNWFTFYHREQN